MMPLGRQDSRSVTSCASRSGAYSVTPKTGCIPVAPSAALMPSSASVKTRFCSVGSTTATSWLPWPRSPPARRLWTYPSSAAAFRTRARNSSEM